jgi:serine/threonine protein kinase
VIQNIITELAESDLEHIISKRTQTQQHFTPKDFKKAAFEIILGIHQMHSKKICHRDLKPENILLINGICKIGDFGSAKTNFQPDATNTPYCVSRYYRAPELILGLKKYNMTIDVWSYGVIL